MYREYSPVHYYIKRSLEPKMSRTFFDRQICSLVSLKSFDQNEHLIPHFKDPIHICLDPEAQERGMTFRTLYAHLIYP